MFPMDVVIIGQIVLAAALGAAIGLERELGAQAAGLRTHMLVSLGAALFTLAGDVGIFGSDPARVAAQVVTGIGFLGGGAIFREGVGIRGLTTAGSLWVTAAIGLAVGVKQWQAAVASTALALLVLWSFKYVERNLLPGRHAIAVTITLQPGAHIDAVEKEIERLLPRARFLAVNYAEHEQTISLTGRADTPGDLPEMAERLRNVVGVAGVSITR